PGAQCAVLVEDGTFEATGDFIEGKRGESIEVVLVGLVRNEIGKERQHAGSLRTSVASRPARKFQQARRFDRREPVIEPAEPSVQVAHRMSIGDVFTTGGLLQDGEGADHFDAPYASAQLTEALKAGRLLNGDAAPSAVVDQTHPSLTAFSRHYRMSDHHRLAEVLLRPDAV